MRIWEHPRHTSFTLHGPSRPDRVGWFSQWRRERRCRQDGGHWWHVDRERGCGWFCCQCAAQADHKATLMEAR